jgi:glyoxylase-like metal-dependent hydrolase (beta-lactamase superfamily II)
MGEGRPRRAGRGDVTLIIDGAAVIVVDRDAEGAEPGPPVRLLRTPGHTAQDISTVASTAGDVVTCTHARWSADGPADDPLGSDAALHAGRELPLSSASVIVPGHGAAFRPDRRAPR